MDFKSVMLVIIAVLIGAGFTLLNSSIEKAVGDMKPKPEVKILYCYKQGDGWPDNCVESEEPANGR